ncbi:class A beta-lactamase-related serine hydrolase [Burkholderia sp. Bp8963]|uniref:serine hydrolase domain-containing protein n=1 Tax=Burkholderia sp. Bp8963 TaxID=2184547 RepID=UPI000F5AB33C|nr:serine hydrolase domain-containing protein [Burkholderia sp. Bp8963]RQS64129.1 class A beta-lactamase-related serine hydrolase [Burkholderia sp. Bp8963]
MTPPHAVWRNGFSRVDDVLRRFIAAEVLPCAAAAVVVGDDIVHQACIGWADRERRVALSDAHVFRIFSNTKLVTSCAALLLVDDGMIDLDEPVADRLPALRGMRVLRAGATRLDDTEPLARPITVRNLFTHTAGFSYAHTRRGTLLGDAYDSLKILQDSSQSLADVVDTLSRLPLMFQPGTRWEYSVSTDVLARLVEVVGGARLDRFFAERIFEPLQMTDTAFHLAPARRHLLAGLYRSVHPEMPLRGGLERCDHVLPEHAYASGSALQSGGGGLLSTTHDMAKLVRSLVSPRRALLKPTSLAWLVTDQLAPGVEMRLPGGRPISGKGFSFCGAVTHTLSSLDPPGALGEVQWGGMAGTHWWVSPSNRSAAVIMTQRHMGFWHLFAFQARREIYAALDAMHDCVAAADTLA